jgi:hypothetical protein
MTNILNHALEAVARPSRVPDLNMGQRVIEIGGDGSVLVIAAFERIGRGEYTARCLKLGTPDVLDFPVNAIKPATQAKIH